MKKTIRHFHVLTATVLTAALSFAFVSCDHDTGIHLTQFLYPTSSDNPYYYGYMPVYADQPIDSIFFATTEQWHLRLEYFGDKSSSDWLKVDDELMAPTFKMLDNSIYYMGGPVFFVPNTTGSKRYVRITVDAGKYVCSGGFIQLPYLSISRPHRFVLTTTTLTSLESRDSLSTLYAQSGTELDSICFNVHADWKLNAKQGTWLQPQVTEGHAGQQVVRLTFQPNPFTTGRTDTLFLSTMGVGSTTGKAIVDTITVTQYGMK